MNQQTIALVIIVKTNSMILKNYGKQLIVSFFQLKKYLKRLQNSTLNTLIILSSSIVYKYVDKLWISCGQTCGQLDLNTPLWIAVDKSSSYPQLKLSYPQNYPHVFFRPRRVKLGFSTFSTGPIIYRGAYIN